MRLARITPKFGGLPELQTFDCHECREVLTFERGDEGDPSKGNRSPLGT